MKEDLAGQAADIAQNADDSLSASRLAQLVTVLFNAYVKRGFTRPEALDMVSDYQHSLLLRALGADDDE